jgi:hypothetical protein
VNAGVTAERVYDALKAHLLGGAVLPGERLELAAFAELLGSSVTPIRDAMHRLAGEHIVEMRPTEGFLLPIVTELALRDLLAWNADLLRLALRHWRPGEPVPSLRFAADDYAPAIRSLFRIIASGADNAEIARHVEAASDRLTPARIAELRLSGPLDAGHLGDELAELAALVDGGDAGPIARWTAAYHRQRIQRVPAIVQAMYRPV